MIFSPLCALGNDHLAFVVRAPVCPNPPPFYKIIGLLPAPRRRKQGPSES
jgi:hypothetical protein